MAAVSAIDQFSVKINGITHLRYDLTVTTDRDTNHLTVIYKRDDELNELINEDIGDTFNEDSESYFASFDDMEEWVAANLTFIPIVLSSVSSFIVSINGVDYNRYDIWIDQLDGELYSRPIFFTETELGPYAILRDIPYYGYSADGVPFESVQAFKNWWQSYGVFNGAALRRNNNCLLINKRPYSIGDISPVWDDENRKMGLKHLFNSASSSFIINPIRYDEITRWSDHDQRYYPFENYWLLVNYIRDNFFALGNGNTVSITDTVVTRSEEDSVTTVDGTVAVSGGVSTLQFPFQCYDLSNSDGSGSTFQISPDLSCFKMRVFSTVDATFHRVNTPYVFIPIPANTWFDIEGISNANEITFHTAAAYTLYAEIYYYL